MRPNIRPGGRAVDVSKAAKALQEGIDKARAAAGPPKPQQAATIPATEKGCCASPDASGACSTAATGKPKAAAPTGAGELRQRHAHGQKHKHKHGHRHGSAGGDCCASDEQVQQVQKQGPAALLAAALAWVKAALSGPGAVAPHMQACGSGGGCCDSGAGPSRLGTKQNGHAFMVVVLTGFVCLPFVLWWMS